LTDTYGPAGTQKKSNIDFANLPLKYNSSGEAIGLNPDARAALKRDGFTDAQIDDIEQKLRSIDMKKTERSNIK
jgi:hypothetical protein